MICGKSQQNGEQSQNLSAMRRKSSQEDTPPRSRSGWDKAAQQIVDSMETVASFFGRSLGCLFLLQWTTFCSLLIQDTFTLLSSLETLLIQCLPRALLHFKILVFLNSFWPLGFYSGDWRTHCSMRSWTVATALSWILVLLSLCVTFSQQELSASSQP